MTMIHEQLLKVMAAIGPIAKDRQMTEGNKGSQAFKFRGIDEFLDAAHPAFIEHQVTCTPQVLETTHVFHDRVDRDTGRVYGFWTHVFVRVQFTFEAADGGTRTAVTAGEGMDLSDKATNKAMSAALKYALVQALTIPVHGALDEQDADQRTSDYSEPQKRGTTRSRQGAASQQRRSQRPQRANEDTPAPAGERTALADTISGAPDEVRREVKAFCVEHGIKLRNASCTTTQLEAVRTHLASLLG